MVARIETIILDNILADRTGLGETGETYIINKDGYAITPLLFEENPFLKFKVESENAKNCLEMLAKHPEESSIHEEQKHIDHKASTVYKDYRGINVLGSHHISHEMSWCILAEVDVTEALAPTKDLLKFSLLRISIVLFIFFIIAYLTARGISKPITALQSGIAIVTKGNLDYKVGTNSKDEIGQLSRAFDKMTKAIKKSHLEINQRVKSQTKEISEKQTNIENQQLATLNILEDVQEEKELTEIEQKKVATILQSIGDGVFVIDKDYKIMIFNEVASQISGFSEEEAVGKNYKKVLKFIFEKDGKINDKFVKDAIKLGTIQEMTNHTLLVRKDKRKIPVADSSAPIKDAEGKVIGCVVVFRDVSKEREIDQMKSDFVSIASHQLRTPLTGIKWVSERLIKHSTSLPEKERQYIEDINLSTKKLSRLVDDLLNVSRIEGGKIAIKPQEIDLNEFIESYLSETSPLITKKKINLTFTNKLKDQKVLTDQSALRNIVQSLVSNAIEYTPEKGEIDILVESAKKKNNFMLKIKDSGIGIPPQNQATIFEKFTRGENAQQIKTDGTGFGLYITKQTVEMLKGEIRFESELNKGTTFFVTLPIKSKAQEGGKSFV
ncbi:MAG: ATP-binding protein [Patescibacteria group bacterium]|nr:ATP-binding protein [Patescibacteria group bacterium]